MAIARTMAKAAVQSPTGRLRQAELLLGWTHPLHVSGKPCASGFRRRDLVKFRLARKAAPG